MAQNNFISDIDDPELSKDKRGGIDINFKRVTARAIRFWYIIVLSVLLACTAAYLINRYSARIYPVTASIIIKQNEENIGAKFLYNNELLNPYRNFFNEIYIMKSYTLLEDVMKQLHFDVSFHIEGNIKTTEFYDSDIPLKFYVLPGSNKKPYGKAMSFRINNDNTFSLSYLSDDNIKTGDSFEKLNLNDTVKINGMSLYISAVGDYSNFKDKPYILRFHDPFELAKSYSNKLKVNWAEQGASVVKLEINGTVPQKEKDFLNKFIEQYQQYDVDKKNKVANMAMQFLDQQLKVIGDSLKLYEDQVENFKKKNIITNLDEETNRLYSKLLSLEDQKFQYRLVENYFGYITTMLQNNQYDGIFTPSSVGITDEIVAGLVNQLIETQTQVKVYQNLSTRGVEKLETNPRLNDKLAQIEQLRGDILKTIENHRQTQKINIKFIDSQIYLVEQQLGALPQTERELITIQRNYSLKENLYVYLLQKRTEAGLSKASTTSDIMIVNPPMVNKAIFPKEGVNYSIAFGAGLLFPLLFFVLAELLNDRIQSREDIEKISSVPVIGGIGHNPGDNALIVHDKPRSAMAESFRALRSNLNYFTGNKGNQVFLVTSSISGEGKSFTTLNLASVFALAGKKTVIVGADLRIPKLFSDLGLSNDTGLSQFLSNMASIDQIIQPSFIDNLYLISGGPMPPNPSELLLKPEMSKLMATLREKFDFVIVDTPPITIVTDAFVLSGYADHTLFIVRQDYTPRGILYSLDDLYTSGKLKNCSILFNDLRKTGLGYGYGNYHSYGYGYGYYGGRKGNNTSGYYHE